MRYKIFVSANQKELREERFAIKDVVNNSETIRGFFDVFLFEDLAAKGKAPVKTYLKHVDNSDIYICIIGREYGIKGEDGFSATEREYRRFLKKKPSGEIIAFVKGQRQEDTKRDKDTRDFLNEIKSSFIYKRFDTVEKLETQVLNSLISFMDDKGELSHGPFDDAICRDADYSAIDEKAVKDYLQNRAVKLKVSIPKISVKDFLIKTLKVVKKENGEIRPANTAILFFGKDPYEYIPHHEIRIARFKGTTRSEFIDSQEIRGPIYKMLDEVETFFKRNTRMANKIVEFKRVDIPEYPYEAIREAIINAIAHRDYKRRGAPIMVAIFDDRVEVRNPGGLLPGLNIKKLEGNHQTRNAVICKIFHETLDMEKFGTGIGKMKRLMKEHGLSSPQFSEEGDVFVVKFFGPGDRILDLVPSIPAERITDLSHLKKRQLEALKLIYNKGTAISRKGYAQRFNTSIRSAQRDLRQLLTEHLITQEGAGRAVKYKKP